MCTWNPYTGRVGPQIMPSALNMSSAQAMASLDALLAVTAGVLLPGHGDPFTQGIPEAVRRAKAAGRSQAAEPRHRPAGVHAPARRARQARAPRPPACPPTRRLPPHCLRTPKTPYLSPASGSGHEDGPVLTSLRAVASSMGPAPNDGHHRATPQAPHAGLRA
jgi:hypothetical protein